MAAATGAGRRALQTSANDVQMLLSTSVRAPFASLLSQVYAKPVQLNLTKLDKPHLDASILAAVAAEKMRDRRTRPRQVHSTLVHDVVLPQQADVQNSADYERTTVKALRRRPSLQSVGAGRAGIQSILGELNPKRVSSITMRMGGRYGSRLNADRAAYAIARKGLSGKAPGFLVRNGRPVHTAYAIRAGKRKTGAFGIKIWLGHA